MVKYLFGTLFPCNLYVQGQLTLFSDIVFDKSKECTDGTSISSPFEWQLPEVQECLGIPTVFNSISLNYRNLLLPLLGNSILLWVSSIAYLCSSTVIGRNRILTLHFLYPFSKNADQMV